MRIYAIGDLHLSSDGSKPMDIYGGPWVNHTEKLKRNWQALVEEDDLVIIPGDISWALKRQDAIEDLNFIAGLPGKKVLIKGNHDLWWSSVTKLNEFHPSMYFLQNTSYIAGDIAICGSRGWTCPGDDDFTEHDEKIYLREKGRMRLSLEAAAKENPKEIIVAMHFPPVNARKDESCFTEIFKEFGVKTVIYGHLHGEDAHYRAINGMHDGIRYHLVSCDFLNCCPLLISR